MKGKMQSNQINTNDEIMVIGMPSIYIALYLCRGLTWYRPTWHISEVKLSQNSYHHYVDEVSEVYKYKKRFGVKECVYIHMLKKKETVNCFIWNTKQTFTIILHDIWWWGFCIILIFCFIFHITAIWSQTLTPGFRQNRMGLPTARSQPAAEVQQLRHMREGRTCPLSCGLHGSPI